MRQVMGGFPVIECLITVLNWREDSRNQVRNKEAVKGRDGLDRKCTGNPGDSTR